MAWLAAKPTSDKPSLSGPEPVSRLEKMTADGVEPDLPPVSAPWVVEKLMEVGPIISAGMGPGPVTWRDLAAWEEVTGFPLDPWEARLIRSLSIDYLGMMNEARKPDCPAPWVPLRHGTVDRDTVDRKVRSALQSFMRTTPRPAAADAR